MKKIIATAAVVSLILLNAGCASQAGKIENRAARLIKQKTFVLYSDTYSNIKGNFTDSEMLIFKTSRSGQSIIDTVCFYKQLLNDETTTFFVNVNIQDKVLRNIDSIQMRTDNKVMTFTASGDQIKRAEINSKRIIEEIFFEIDYATVSEILYCSQIAFQYAGGPFVEISAPDEIHAIKSFFNYGVF